jgi:hypothetical protein
LQAGQRSTSVAAKVQPLLLQIRGCVVRCDGGSLYKPNTAALLLLLLLL